MAAGLLLSGMDSWPAAVSSPMLLLGCAFGVCWLLLANIRTQWSVTRLASRACGSHHRMELVTAVLSSMWLNREMLSVVEWCGAALILAAAWLEARGVEINGNKKRESVGVCAVAGGLLQWWWYARAALPKRIDYRCANGEVQPTQVQRLPENNAAAVLVDGNPIVLSRANSAAQEKYGDGRYVLYLQGEHAMLEDNGRVVFGQCNAGPLPKRVVEGLGK